MNIIKNTLYQLLLIICCCFWGISIEAQVFPGDANNNGEVDNVDLLYVGYAFGHFGPAREVVDVEFSSQTILLPWEQEFPDGLNYAYADTDGDGLVDMGDMLTIFVNYGMVNEPVVPIEFPIGNADVNPAFDLNTSVIPNQLTAGSVVDIPITLGSPDQPVIDLNGIAFSVRYNKDVVKEISLQLDSPWLENGTQGSLFHFQVFPSIQDGVLDVALTRFGPQPVSGYGEIGVLSIVIEDDLLDLLPGQDDSLEVAVEIEDILMLNQGFETVPVAADQVALMLYHPGAITGIKEPEVLQSVSVFPNPVQDILQIDAPVEIHAIRLLSALGQECFAKEVDQAFRAKIDTDSLAEGIYLVQIFTEAGMAKRKVLVLKP